MCPRGHNHPAMPISTKIEIESESLTSRLRARIEHEGPISFRDWMAAALYDERDGYYCRLAGVRQGRAGDYRTAPESSPLFAATFARYFSELFFELGAPSSWTIFEVGAGSGEFAHGVLTALQARHPSVFAATTYLIDEISNAARLRVADRLVDFADRVRFERLLEVSNPVGAGIVFSNELVDAFPVQRITMRAGRLREICVGVDQENFVWVECDPDKAAQDYCRRVGLQVAEGQIAEVNLDAEDFLARAAAALERGFMITVDYGAERDELLKSRHRHEGTLRAFRRHELIDDVLASPGEQDLTTTIDWSQIREAGARAGLETLRHERLDQFLLREGIIDELERLASKSTELDALRLRTSAREMIMPQGLAASFKVLVLKKGA
jgi:SAM-dependent MidA family methyltransferase